MTAYLVHNNSTEYGMIVALGANVFILNRCLLFVNLVREKFSLFFPFAFFFILSYLLFAD